MVKNREFGVRARQIGATIQRIREARGLDRAPVAAACGGMGADALRHIETGRSGSEGFIKLARLAEVLHSTPNELLGYESAERMQEDEAIRGLLEGVALAFGLPLERAAPLADTVLTVRDSPDIRNMGIPLRDSARIAGKVLAGRFLRQESG